MRHQRPPFGVGASAKLVPRRHAGLRGNPLQRFKLLLEPARVVAACRRNLPFLGWGKLPHLADQAASRRESAQNHGVGRR
jgi:hypothetical protein